MRNICVCGDCSKKVECAKVAELETHIAELEAVVRDFLEDNARGCRDQDNVVVAQSILNRK